MKPLIIDSCITNDLFNFSLICHSRLSGVLLKKDSGQAGMSAPGSVHGQRGESPLQADALRPVTERNCVTVR